MDTSYSSNSSSSNNNSNSNTITININNSNSNNNNNSNNNSNKNSNSNSSSPLPSPRSLALRQYFSQIDARVSSCASFSLDRFVYQGRDVLVQYSLELPIIVSFPNSMFNLRFSSSPGDIDFGIVFVESPSDPTAAASDLTYHNILKMGRIQSHINPFTLKFQTGREGVLVLMWMNKFDWLSNKKISYLLEEFQPAFHTYDIDRAEDCLERLDEVNEEIEEDEAAIDELTEYILHQQNYISVLDKKAIELGHELDRRWEEREALLREAAALKRSVEVMKSTLPGLGIR